MKFRQILCWLFFLFFPIQILSQSATTSSKILQFLKQECNICHPNQQSANSKLKEINNLFHLLHDVVNRQAEDSIKEITINLHDLLQENPQKINFSGAFYNFYGSRLFYLELYQEAIVNFELALNYSKTPQKKGSILLNLATANIHGNKISEGLAYLNQAEEIFKDFDKLSLIKVYKNQAVCYIEQLKYETAKTTYKKAIDIELELSDSMGLAVSYMNLANVYYNQYLDNEAIPFFKKSLEMAKAVNDTSLLIDAHDNMAIVYEDLGNFKKAYQELSQVQVLKDELNNSEKIRALSNQEKKYVEEKKNAEIYILEKDKELAQQQRNFSILASLAFLIISFLVGYQYRSTLKKNKIINTQKQKVDELNTIKDELLSVLGHDLRTPMQHLISVFDRSFRVLKKGDEGKLLKLLQHGHLAVSQTAILLDNVLQWVTQQNKQGYFKKESVALFPLIQQIQGTFLPITQMRAIELVNEVDAENTILADRNSLKIIIRNLVDNAIKFSAPNGQIRITASTNVAGQQGIHIQDTGVGMSADIQAKILSTSAATVDASGRKSTGLGLRICKEFIQRHDGELTIESVEGEGSRFSVWLPLG